LWQDHDDSVKIVSSFDDIGSAYVSDVRTVNKLAGAIPERFNSGMCLVNRFGRTEFEMIEGFLQAFAKHEPDLSEHMWVEQTIYALFAGRWSFHRMGPQYQIGGITGEAIAVHYAGFYRELFYTEGISQLDTRD
jgi:hypothetical protein